MLSRIYADALHIPASTPKYERVPMHKLLVQRTRRLARVYADDPVIGKFKGKLNRASGDLFQFVLDPRIPPTNNAAERGLREIVVHRKIRGSIRSRETMQWMGNLFTCVTTWKAMNTDCLAEIVNVCEIGAKYLNTYASTTGVALPTGVAPAVDPAIGATPAPTVASTTGVALPTGVAPAVDPAIGATPAPTVASTTGTPATTPGGESTLIM